MFGPIGFAPAPRLDRVRTLPFRRDYGHPHRDAQAFGALVRALGRFDLVHAHAAKAGVLGRIAAAVVRRPAVYTPHCFPFVGEISTARHNFGLGMERALASRTAALICVSADERAVAEAAGIGAPLHVVHNGCPPCEGARAHREDPRPTVGAVTVLRRQKRLDVLLDAAPAIVAAGARVTITGDGPEAAALRAHPNAGQVEFLPFHPPAAAGAARARRLRPAQRLGGVPDRRARGAGVRRAAGGDRRRRHARGGRRLRPGS